MNTTQLIDFDYARMERRIMAQPENENQQIIPFDFKGNQVRTIVDENGDPWFIGRQIAQLLGYTNPSKALKDHCKGVTKRYLPSAGGVQVTNIIPERDPYRLIINSELESAQEFEEWVVGTVLPTIRKNGGYIHATPEMSDEEILARALKVADSTLERVQQERDKALKANLELARRNVKLFHQNEAMAGPVEFFHELMDTSGTYTFTDVAKMFGRVARSSTRISANAASSSRAAGTTGSSRISP